MIGVYSKRGNGSPSVETLVNKRRQSGTAIRKLYLSCSRLEDKGAAFRRYRGTISRTNTSRKVERNILCNQNMIQFIFSNTIEYLKVFSSSTDHETPLIEVYTLRERGGFSSTRRNQTEHWKETKILWFRD